MPISTINQNGLNAPLTLTSPVLTTPNLGTPSALVLTNATALPKVALPTGSVLQVVFGSYNSRLANSTTTYNDTNLTATITPLYATSKILVIGSQADCYKDAASNQQSIYLALFRNGTQIYQFSDRGLYSGPSAQEAMATFGFNWLDSPATTSALTYKTMFKAFTTTGLVSVQQQGSSSSTITLMEIAA